MRFLKLHNGRLLDQLSGMNIPYKEYDHSSCVLNLPNGTIIELHSVGVRANIYVHSKFDSRNSNQQYTHVQSMNGTNKARSRHLLVHQIPQVKVALNV